MMAVKIPEVAPMQEAAATLESCKARMSKVDPAAKNPPEISKATGSERVSRRIASLR